MAPSFSTASFNNLSHWRLHRFCRLLQNQWLRFPSDQLKPLLRNERRAHVKNLLPNETLTCSTLYSCEVSCTTTFFNHDKSLKPVDNLLLNLSAEHTTFLSCTAPADPGIVVGTVEEVVSLISPTVPGIAGGTSTNLSSSPTVSEKTSCVALAATCGTSESPNAVVVVLWAGSLSPECSVDGISQTWIRLHRFQAESYRTFENVGQFQHCPLPFARKSQCSPNHVPQQQQC